MDGGGSFVFRKAFLIKRAQSWDALVNRMVIRESCTQAGPSQTLRVNLHCALRGG